LELYFERRTNFFIYLNFIPGVGGSVSIYNYYVPLYSKNYLEVKKQIADIPEFIEQSGTGTQQDLSESNNEDILGQLNKHVKDKMDPNIYESFQKPNFVKTDEILFTSKRKLSSEDGTNTKKLKTIKGGSAQPININHKFKFHGEKY